MNTQKRMKNFLSLNHYYAFRKKHTNLMELLVTILYTVFCVIQLMQLYHVQEERHVFYFTLANMFFMALAIFFRNKYPVGALSVAVTISTLLTIMEILLLQNFSLDPNTLPLLVFNSLFEPIALTILLYTIGTKTSLRTTFLCTIIVSIIVVTLELIINDSLLNNFSPLVINITIFIIATLVGSTVQFHSSRIIQLEHLNKQLELERKQHEQLIISAERTRIAREMHDIVAHSLAIVITMADGAEAMIEKNPDLAKQAINQIAQTGRSALAETRRLVGILRENTQINREEIEELANELNTQTATGLTPIIPKKTKPQTTKSFISKDKTKVVPKDKPKETSTQYVENQEDEKAPLTPQPTSLTIESLIEEFRNADLPIEYKYIGKSIENDSALGLTVYRILQEALTNILRYAPFSPSVTVTINRFHGGVSILVKNLAGASVSLMKGSGKGIIGMRERAAVYDGYVQAGPTENGWQVKAFLRLNDKTGESGSWTAPN